MGKIIILDEHTANKIAAGEVVERPAAIVKELCENSIDAGASSITVEIKNGGISYIRIIDNGTGISKDDIEIAFEKHSTSKIRNANDLYAVTTMGFRGEALASISAVSRVEVVTRTHEDTEGSKIMVEGGNVGQRVDFGCSVGTSIVVRDLFYNTPARYKFLKKDYTEAGYIEDTVTRLALGYPNISFKFINSGSLVFQTPGNNNLLSCAYSIYGNTAKSTVSIEYEEGDIRVTGLAGKPEIVRSNRSRQILFINRRHIKNKTITAAIEEAYKTLVPVGKFPFVIINLEIDPQNVDVNVHPTKQEVRFSDESQIFRVTYHAIKNALYSGANLVPEFTDKTKSKDACGFKMELPGNKAEIYEQKGFANTENNSKSIFSPGLNKTNFGNNYKNQSNSQEKYFDIQKNESESNKNQTEESIIGNLISEPQNIQPKPANNIVHGLPVEMAVREENECYAPVRIVGTAFGTYIIVEFNNELYIIDQHAAHERVMYEKLKKEREEGDKLSQALLIPEILELTHKEINIVEQNRTMLTEIGFNIELFGNNTLKVSSIPLTEGTANAKDMFLGVIDDLIYLTKTGGKNIEDNLLYTIACKSAVKANFKLTDKEIYGLLNSMVNLENPYTCPHGRPTAIKMTKREIERKFGRT